MKDTFAALNLGQHDRTIREVAVISRLEFVATARQRWVRGFAVAFSLLLVGVAVSAGSLEELAAPEGFARTTVALVPLVVALVPLAALLLGVSGQAGDVGSEDFLFAQPVTRFQVVFGRWLGQFLALSSALVLGFGAGGLFLAATVGPSEIGRFLFFVLVSILLAAVFLAIAAAVAARVEKRATALVVAAFAWFLFVLLYDGVALGLAGWISGRTGARILCASVFGNPAGLVRVLALSVSGTPNVLGAAGEAWQRLLGGALEATLIAVGALLAWVAAPLGAAKHFIDRRDL